MPAAAPGAPEALAAALAGPAAAAFVEVEVVVMAGSMDLELGERVALLPLLVALAGTSGTRTAGEGKQGCDEFEGLTVRRVGGGQWQRAAQGTPSQERVQAGGAGRGAGWGALQALQRALGRAVVVITHNYLCQRCRSLW
jgi:hypothetical protein